MMRQTRLRPRRRRAGPDDGIDLPQQPVSDTSAAGALVTKIDQVLAD
jgi:hypothetical protein